MGKLSRENVKPYYLRTPLNTRRTLGRETQLLYRQVGDFIIICTLIYSRKLRHTIMPILKLIIVTDPISI